MKKVIVTVGIAILVFIIGIVGAKVFLFSDSDDDGIYTADENGVVLQDEIVEEGSHTYENGLASFTYDGAALSFTEIPSDDESGYPMTSFVLSDSEDVLPRVDIYPLTLTIPFDENAPKDDWETLVKTMLKAYYNKEEQESVDIVVSNTVVKTGEDMVKMFSNFETTLVGSVTPNLTGAARLVANDKTAVLTLALTHKGGYLPQEMIDLYMSSQLH